MKLNIVAHFLTRLIECVVMQQKFTDKEKHFPTAKSITELLTSWKLWSSNNPNNVYVTYGLRIMGCGETIYVKVGSIVFAIVHNYDACPDGMNRTLSVVPLYWAEKDGPIVVYGFDEIPSAAIIECHEAILKIVEGHLTK